MSVDPQVSAWMDQMREMVSQDIRRHGVHLQFVLGDSETQRPGLASTVGLFGIGHPELLLLGLCHHDAGGLLHHLAAQIRDGRQLVAGELITFPERPPRLLVEASPNPGAIVFSANRHYQRPDAASVPVLQLTWDDDAGRSPGTRAMRSPPGTSPAPARSPHDRPRRRSSVELSWPPSTSLRWSNAPTRPTAQAARSPRPVSPRVRRPVDRRPEGDPVA